MFLIAQMFLYLAIALIVGGGVGFMLRACLGDSACDGVRDDLKLAQDRYEALLEEGLKTKSKIVHVPSTVAPQRVEPIIGDLNARDLETRILASAPGTSPSRRLGVDDLTIIKGITPRLDTWLAQNNITRFEHLVGLSAAELYWLVENAPENGSSIYRDNWVAQARAQMR
jgi:predicted flap endonuclease-1-like 5' DNA nuclease